MFIFFQKKRRYVYDMYKEVVRSFPVKEDEIKIEYNLFSHFVLDISASYTALNIVGTKKKPVISIARKFFSLTREEQKGIIAHEIGHHETVKDYTIPRLKRTRSLLRMYKSNQIPSSKPHWEERLRKFHILDEKGADNKIAKTKYGKYRLKYYKNRLPPSYKIGQELIKNLEEKIKS